MTQIIQQDISERVPYSFLNYAMYVITDRALPNIRDGLKPVQRRILYDMYELGLFHNRPHKKSARTVGDVIGKYHPHGDSSVYEAMVKMAQDFNTRYPLVDIHGNAGSIDGDSAAAMRYTEARLALPGEQMLKDINKNTVNFVPNYDESLEEPEILPTFFPQLLVNGVTGIAVGMASSAPPHHADSIYNALKYMIKCELEGKEITIDNLIDIVQAPDFPTGGEIIELQEVHKGYRTGKGKVTIRAKYDIEETKNSKLIVVTEIPYQVNKAKLVAKIDELRKESIPEIKEVRDESDKDGIRIVIEIRKTANADWIMKKLYKRTSLQSSFSMNMVALVNGVPHQYNLKEALEYFLAHVAEIIIRRTQFDLDKATKRLHIVEGILTCLGQIDEVIAVIKASKTNEEVITNLQSNFDLSEEQAQAIANMRLRTLSQASAEEYSNEKAQLEGNIEKWNDILSNNNSLLNTMLVELDEASKIFKDERRSTIVTNVTDSSISERELVKDQDLIVTLTRNGLLKSIPETEYSKKNRGTKGTKAGNLKDDDSIEFMLTINSRDDILFFTNQGKCHVLGAYKIPISSRTNVGRYVNNFIQLEENEKIVSMLSKTIDDTEQDLLFATKHGIGKRLKLEELSKTRNATKVITFKENDELVSVNLLNNDEQIVVLTAKGQAVKIDPNADGKGIRPMGRTAAGVKLVRLTDDDYVVNSVIVNDEESLLLVTENGLGKRINFSDLTLYNRGAKGMRAITINERTGPLVGAISVNEDHDLFVATAEGLLNRISIDGIRIMGRNASGVKIINLNEGDSVVSISRDLNKEDEEE